MRQILLPLGLALIAAPALAAPTDYAVACSAACTVVVVTPPSRVAIVQKPAGYVRNRIVFDPASGATYPAPAGAVLIQDAADALPIGATASAAQIAAGVTNLP